MMVNDGNDGYKLECVGRRMVDRRKGFLSSDGHLRSGLFRHDEPFVVSLYYWRTEMTLPNLVHRVQTSWSESVRLRVTTFSDSYRFVFVEKTFPRQVSTSPVHLFLPLPKVDTIFCCYPFSP